MPRRFRPRARSPNETADAPCRAPQPCGVTRKANEEPGPLPPPSRQRGWLSRPRASSIVECTRRAFANLAPATVRTTWPPCAGFRRSFAAPRSRVRWLDPPGDPRALRPWTRQATRRSPTSAINANLRARPGTVRTPRTAHAVAHVCSTFSRVASIARESNRGQPSLRGPGANPQTVFCRMAPFDAIARAESFAPTQVRLGHLVSRTRGDCGWSIRSRPALFELSAPLIELAVESRKARVDRA